MTDTKKPTVQECVEFLDEFIKDIIHFENNTLGSSRKIFMFKEIKGIVEKHGSRVEFGFGRIGIGVAGEKGKPTNELMIWNLKTEQPIGSEVKNTKGKTSDDVNTISRWRFNNLESLQVVIDALNDIKAGVFGEQHPQLEDLVEEIDTLTSNLYNTGHVMWKRELRPLLQSRQPVVTRVEIEEEVELIKECWLNLIPNESIIEHILEQFQSKGVPVKGEK